jgi:hypothetical protein
MYDFRELIILIYLRSSDMALAQQAYVGKYENNLHRQKENRQTCISHCGPWARSMGLTSDGMQGCLNPLHSSSREIRKCCPLLHYTAPYLLLRMIFKYHTKITLVQTL